ncbi:MAG: hypothetical protein NTV89_05865 [Proteobacteria bacterium]|nr:hypothetical protein [Pseudomonadota bacterium]
MKLQHAVFVVFVCGAGVLLLNPAARADALKINEAWSAPEAGNQYMPSAPCAFAPYQVAAAAEPDVRSNKKNGQHTEGTADSSKVKKTNLIEAEVAAVLSPNEIEVNMLGKKQVIKLAGVKDCPCDFNEQATKIAHAETKASKGFTVVDAGTVVRRCREIKDFLSDSIADEVQIKLSSTRRDSSGRLTGIVWNKGKSKTLNDTVQSYTQKQGVSEKKKDEHHSYKKFKAKNK